MFRRVTAKKNPWKKVSGKKVLIFHSKKVLWKKDLLLNPKHGTLFPVHFVLGLVKIRTFFQSFYFQVFFQKLFFPGFSYIDSFKSGIKKDYEQDK